MILQNVHIMMMMGVVKGYRIALRLLRRGVAAAAVRDGSVAEIGISRVGPAAQDVIVDDFCAS